MLAQAIRDFPDPKLGPVKRKQIIDVNVDRFKVLRERGLVRLPPKDSTVKRTVPTVQPREGWDQVPCVIVGSGPSLAPWQIELIERKQVHVIAVSDNYQLLPCADVIYSADHRWWKEHHRNIAREGHTAERFTQDYNASVQFGLSFVLGKNQPGLSTDPQWIHTGSNSGYQAINLAYHLGARELILVGFDMQYTDGKAHWFGSHPGTLPDPHMLNDKTKQAKLLAKFARLAKDLEAAGVQVLNCTEATALQCFERKGLKDALRHRRNRPNG